MRRFAAVCVALWATGAAAQAFRSANYTCDNGAAVMAHYLGQGEGATVLMLVDGQQMALYAQPSASGVRYVEAGTGAVRVWFTKDSQAMWMARAADGAEEVLARCSETGS